MSWNSTSHIEKNLLKDLDYSHRVVETCLFLDLKSITLRLLLFQLDMTSIYLGRNVLQSE